MSDFYKYFSENMDALHLPAPHSLFSTAKQAKETIGALAGATRAFGTKATVGEIIGTIPNLAAAADLITLGSAISASFYLGACIGSLAVALGRTMSGGKQIVDFFQIGQEATGDAHLTHRAYNDYVHAGGRIAHACAAH